MEEYKSTVLAEIVHQAHPSVSGRRKWSPHKTSRDLVLWYDGAQRDSMVGTGDNVSVWKDKGPYGQHLTNPRPLKLTRGYHGLKGDASEGTFMKSNLTFDWQNVSFAVTVVATATTSSLLTNRLKPGGGNSSTWFTIASTHAEFCDGAPPTYISYGDGPGKRMYTLIKNSDGVQIRVNGALAGSVGTTSIGDQENRVAVGIWCCPTAVVEEGGSTGSLNGTIHEIVLHSAIDAYQKIEGYLGHKWGVNMSEAHPYKKNPPR